MTVILNVEFDISPPTPIYKFPDPASIIRESPFVKCSISKLSLSPNTAFALSLK